VATLFRVFNPRLVRYIDYHTDGAGDDLSSEVWLNAARVLPRFEGDLRSFRTLLFEVARKRVVDHSRRFRRRPTVVTLTAADDRGDGTELETTVVSELSTREAVEALVGGISSAQAEVVLLRVVDDLSVDEVARVLGKSPGAVRVLQHRALQAISKKFPQKAVTR
jgi:RNA polymerase sigma-70 factor, ECF subfamily